ncbi:serine O-acetyltransferase [Actinocrispum wychmicini]|uniref:serine O-acetyltransferase n=1 Tax=Actinocrispum wychmicini TaxID=1213861 RepID=UPI001A9DBBBB|nr:serine O-acetyltransferase [Actinocrispum wychmicini]
MRAVENWIEPRLPDLLGIGVDVAALTRKAADRAVDDLFALVQRDPAGMGSWEYVLDSYACFQAILAHRFTHGLLTCGQGDPRRRRTMARKLSEEAKVRTGVEIHPAATIGPRFVVDHGIGTVIGEDVTIGADCYVLQGVVLGALGIADNVAGRRHPRLGDRVQVGGFARVLGPISVGDDVTIGSHALVRADVPAGAQVVVLHQYQMVTGPRPITVYGVEALGEYRFRLHGTGLDRHGVEVDLLGPTHLPLASGDWSVLQGNAKCITVQISPRAHGLRSVAHIRLRHAGSEVTVGIPLAKRHRKGPIRHPASR